MARLSAEDFPLELNAIVHQSTTGTPVNAVIFLAGLGDTSANFSSFSRALNLPDTISITLQGPYPLPFPLGPGQQWSEDVQIDTLTGEFDPDSPLTKSTALLVEIIRTLTEKHNFESSHIHLFGFGQGGAVALSAALQWHKASLGGVVSIGGALPLSTGLGPSSKVRTPAMLLGGLNGAFAKDDGSPVKRIKASYEFVEYHQWKKPDDSLPRNREEALPMMQFLARRLKSRRGVPEGAVEV